MSILINLFLSAAALVAVPDTTCRMQKLEAERLPDLNTPRAGHQTLIVDGELIVVGGHTSGFVPTQTAEFLRPGDKEWRQQATVYTHDFGTAVQLRSGEVLLMGGAAEPLGIGQTFCVERYVPAARTFEGFGCLDTKRMYASAEQLSDGRVLVTGNWYHPDDMELFDGRKFFASSRSVQRALACPYIFPTADGDALIMGSLDNRGVPLTDYSATVERLFGEPVEMPLLHDWRPLPLLMPLYAKASCVGDTARGDYAYLIILENRQAELRVAQLKTGGGEASAPTLTLIAGLPPLPAKGVDGQPIGYASQILVDREAGRGYVVGHDARLGSPADGPADGRDSLVRHYVYSFSYKPPFSATLYYTDPIPGIGYTSPVLTPNGDIVLVAGVASDHFTPFSAAYRLPLGRPDDAACTASTAGWLWWVLGLTGVLVAVVVVIISRRRSHSQPVVAEPEPEPEAETGITASPSLMPRILELIEQQRLYLNSSLTVSDVADRLGTHRNAVSQCIMASTGCSFPQFITRYRVEHAQRLILQCPDMKLSAIAEESGFTTESTFFRTFKATVGMTPREWVNQQTDKA